MGKPMAASPLFVRDDNTLTRDLTLRTIQVRAETIDEEARSVEAVLATEQPVRVYDYRAGGLIEEVLRVDGAQLPDQLPLLANHDRWSLESVLGSVREIRREGETIVGRMFFAEGDEDSDRAWNKVRQGHLTDTSVGYRVEQYTDIPAGKTAEVNGRSYTAGARPLRVSTAWQPKEQSLVPIGADSAAKIRELGRQPASHKETSMLERLQKYLESIGLRRDATEEQAQAFLASLSEDRARVANLLELEASSDTGRIAARAALAEMGLDPDTLNRRAADPPEGPEGDGNSQSERNDDRAVAQARETERARIREIHRIAGSDLSEEQVQRAIDEDWSLDRVRQEALDSLRRGSQPLHTGPGSAPAGHVRSHETDCTRETLAYGLMLRGGIETIDPSASEQRREEQARLSEQAHRYSDLSLVDICREAIRVDGGRTPVGRSEAIRAAVSGGTLSYVFTTSAYAAVLMGYQEADDTTDWCSVEDVPNFMEHDAIQLDKTSLDKHPRGGTAKHAAPSDTREQYRAQRYSKQFVIDEMDILDDRLGAIVGTVPREMGAAAARLRSDLVYAEILANEALADTGALFNSTAVTTAGGHANLGTSALAAAALGAATTAMMQQKQSGVRLNLRPRYLVVNPTLEWTARELVSSGEIIVAGDTDTVRGARNVLRDLNLQVRVEGRLDASGVTDPDSGTAYTGSATAWYLFSAPGKTIHVVYRAGTGRRPSLRRFVLDQGQWGIGWDINMDVGVKALDYRGCYCGKA